MQSRCASSARRTASWLPASSAATSFESSICVLIPEAPLRTSPDTRLPSARPSTAAIACFIADPHVLGRLRAAVAHGPLDDRRELLLGELGRQVAADQLGLGLLAAGEILAAGLAVGAARPPAGACARGAAPPARPPRHASSEPSLAAFCSSESTSRSAPTRCFSPARIAPLQVGLDLLEYLPSDDQDTPVWRSRGQLARSPRVRAVARVSSGSRAAAGQAPGRGRRRDRTASATFQSTSRRSLRPMPGISSRW